MRRKLELGALAVVVGLTMLVVLRPFFGSERAAEPLPSAPPVSVAEDDPALRVPEPSAAEAIRASAPAPAVEDQAPDALGVLVYGSITGSDASLVEDGYLYFEHTDGEILYGSFGAAGSYSVLGLRPGAWTFRANCDGYFPSEQGLEVPAGEARVRRDLVLEPSITVRVKFQTPEGEELEAALGRSATMKDIYPVCVATLEPPPAFLAGVRGRDASRFGVGKYSHRAFRETLPGQPADVSGLLELQCPPPVFVSAVLRNVVLDTRPFEGGDEIVFVLERERFEAALGAVSLTVVDAFTGSPITAGHVDLNHSQRGGLGQPIGADGRVEFDDVLPGVMELDFRIDGYERLKKRVHVRPGQALDLGAYALAPAATIRGRTLDAQGVPRHAGLVWVPLDHVERADDVEQRFHFKSDAGGEFELLHAGRGNLFIVVSDPKWAACAVLVDARSGLVENVEVPLREGTPVTIATDAAHVAGHRVTLADSLGRPFWTRRTALNHSLRLVLLPGDYQLWLDSDELRLHSVAFTVAADPVRVEVPALGGRR